MKTLELSEKYFISKGKHRKVYLHPTDSEKCIKIPRAGLKKRSRDREIKYLLKYSKWSSNYLSMYLGNVITNLGSGDLFHLIRNSDGSISKPLSELEKLEGIEEKIYDLYLECMKHRVVISDLNEGNIVAQMFGDSAYKLWIIDGVGNSDYIKVCDFSKYLLCKKMNRKFSRLARSLGFQLDTSEQADGGQIATRS